jgi:hypothetical protein
VGERRSPDAGDPGSAARWYKRGMRRWLHWVALVLAALLAVLSIVAIWTRNQVVSTDRYVRTVAPLATEPPIQDLLVDALTTKLADPARTTDFARQLLPARAEPLAAPIAAAVRSFVRDELEDFVRSDEFKRLWEDVSRRTHDAAVALLTGEDEGRLQIVGDRLVLRLGPLLGPAEAFVRRAGLDAPLVTEGEEPEIVLADASSVDRARGAVNLLQKLAWVLPILALVCMAGAVFTAPGRRIGILRCGVALAVAMMLLGAGLLLGRSLYLDAVTSPQLPEDAAAAVFDTLLHYLRNGILILLAAGLLVAAGAWIAGRRGRAQAGEAVA